MPRYPSPYPQMIRGPYPPRPLGAAGIIPPISRPPVPLVRGPIIPPTVRPAVPSVTPAEKPQTTVYVGKISSTVENDFILSLLQLCGPVKSWKRAQTNGTYRGFGFCEYESAEGVLRALRLLSKLNLDGQELMLKVDDATRTYLKNYVEKKVESSKKPNEAENAGAEKVEEDSTDAMKKELSQASQESSKSSLEGPQEGDNDLSNKENNDAANFGLVTNEDREADKEALNKLTGMLEERLKNNPLPPPPPPPVADGSDKSSSEHPAKPKDGEADADTTISDSSENRIEDETKNKPSDELDRSEMSSPDHRRHEGRSRDRDKDSKREKERELERYEREREQERAKREKDREYKIREDERRYKAREKEWESREREKEHWRKREREREKERAQERKWEITDQEREIDDGYSKKRKHRSNDEERRRRQREKEDDLADRLKEDEEIADAKRRADEERHKKQQEETDNLSGQTANGSSNHVLPEETHLENKDRAGEHSSDPDSSHDNFMGEENLQNGKSDDTTMALTATADTRQNNSGSRKLGFGLLGSVKRTAVPSVFNEDEDEDMQKEKRMRPLVPIDYSTEEQQAIQPSSSEAPPSNLVAAAEFAKRISSVNTKEEKPDSEKERSRRSHDRSSHRDRDRDRERERERNDEETVRIRDDRREGSERDRVREHGLDKVKIPDNQKLMDAKQLIDMIPKTKDELFSYEINWATYDKNSLHERMRPWISKKITEFLGEEETSLVDYIVSSTQEHVGASMMLDRLQAILDDEAEMFVLKMWRMLIFEIKKVETGLALRSKS